MDVSAEPVPELLLGLVVAAGALDPVLVDRALLGDAGVQFREGDIGRPLVGLVVEAIDVELIIEIHGL